MAKTLPSHTPVAPKTAPVSGGWLESLRGGLVLIVLCGGVYPAITVVVGAFLFPHQSTGSLIEADGRTIGSALVGQPFAAPGYFHGRPSAAGYDPFGVSGSNLAPSNPDLRQRAEADSLTVIANTGTTPAAVPVDLIAASGSGIDPHISPAAAHIQAERVATARGMSPASITRLITEYTEGPVFGVLGQPRVNVLQLNLALDALSENTP